MRLAPLGLIVTIISRLPDLFLPLVAAFYGAREGGFEVLPVVGLVVLVSIVFRWLSWLRFHYYIGDDEIRIEQGLISRSARSIPFDRIADVSTEQPALARILGLAVVRFETGGGKGEDAELRYVEHAEAEQLRVAVRSRINGNAAPAHRSPAPDKEPPARLLFAMDTVRLLTLGLYSFSLVFFAVLIGAAQQLDFLLPFDWDDAAAWVGLAAQGGSAVIGLDYTTQLYGVVAALTGLVILGLGSGIIRTLLTDWGFRLERTAKGLRRRRGLLTLTDVTVPVERVQAVEIGTGPVRQRRGWHSLRLISLATGSGSEIHHAVAPLAKLDEIRPIVDEVRLKLPTAALEFTSPPPGPWIDHALVGAAPLVIGAGLAAAVSLPAAGLLTLPALAIAANSWLSWRHTSRAVDADQLYARRGWWNRSLTIAPQLNVQTVTLSSSPLERLRGLATVHFGIAGGELHLRAVPLADAHAIRAQVLELVTPVDFSRLALR